MDRWRRWSVWRGERATAVGSRGDAPFGSSGKKTQEALQRVYDGASLQDLIDNEQSASQQSIQPEYAI